MYYDSMSRECLSPAVQFLSWVGDEVLKNADRFNLAQIMVDSLGDFKFEGSFEF